MSAAEIVPPDLAVKLKERKTLLSEMVKGFMFIEPFNKAHEKLAAFDKAHPDVVQYLKEKHEAETAKIKAASAKALKEYEAFLAAEAAKKGSEPKKV